MKPACSLFSARWLSLFVLLLLLASYGWTLYTYFVPVTGGTDQNGYHVGSWLLADQGRYSVRPSDEYEFVGHMWVKNPDGLYYPKYPPLYPALAAAAIRLTGHPYAGFWLSPVCALLTVAGVYALIRCFLDRGSALTGAVLMAGTPVFLYYGLNKASHAPSMAFLAWGFAAFFSGCKPSRLRNGILLCTLSGLLMGFAVGIRYTNALLLLPPLVHSLLTLRGKQLLRLLGFAAGAAVPGLALAVFHTQAYGAPWRTGYAMTQEQTGFSWEYFLPNLRLYTTGILDHGSGPFTLFACIGLVLLLVRQPKRALVFLSWLVPLFVLYCCYYWAPTNSFAGYIRFVMPLLPPLYLLGLWGLHELLTPCSRRARAGIVAVVLLVQGAWGVYQGLEQAEGRWRRDLLAAKTVAFTEEEVPEGSVIFSETGHLNHLDFQKRWRLYSTLIFDPNQIRRRVENRQEADVTPLQAERVDTWSELLIEVPKKDYHQALRSLVQGDLDSGRAVYFLGPERRIHRIRNRFRWLFVFEQRAELTGEIPNYLWVDANRSSMRNLETEAMRPIPKQVLLEVTRVLDRAPDRSATRENLLEERREKMEELRREFPEVRELFRQLEYLEREIRKRDALRDK